MKKITILLALISFLLSCHHNSEIPECNKMIKVKITDGYLIEIITKYTNQFHIDGKGIPIVTINSFNQDTIKYYIGMIFKRSEFQKAFPQKSYFLYDTINNCIVIINSKLENIIRPSETISECDTILNKLFINENGPPGLIDIFFFEFCRVDTNITRKVIYDYPY